MRYIADISVTEDVDVKASTYIDPSLSPDQQGQSFLGYSEQLSTWTEGTTRKHVPVMAANAANPFFADYQPQNAGVFSYFDDLSFVDDFGAGTFANARISYSVIGYHPSYGNDPLSAPIEAPETIYTRLAAMGYQPMNAGTVTDLDRQGYTFFTVCHGNIFNVGWNTQVTSSNPKVAISYPADEIQADFRESHPLSVGTSPLDALFGWLEAVDDTTVQGLPPADRLPAATIITNLKKLHTLILDLNDDLDSQLQAQDLIATNNFISSAQGKWWHLAPSTDKDAPKIPSVDVIERLRAANAIQDRINSLTRKKKKLQKDIFSTWWTYAADRLKGTPANQTDRLNKATQAIKTAVTDLQFLTTDEKEGISALQTSLDAAISSFTTKADLKKGTEHAFYRQRDPTLFIAGMRTGWPDDWTDILTVRTTANCERKVGTHSPSTDTIEDEAGDHLVAYKLPSDIYSYIQFLMREASWNWTDDTHTNDPPQYYKTNDRFTGKNAWFPLFIEYEIEYYHVPWSAWQFGPQGSESRVGYSVANTYDLTAVRGDVRIIKGRCPMLPQASTVLANLLKQAFDRIGAANLPSDLDTAATIKAAATLDTVSTPLSGFTEQLITYMTGTHMTPLTYDDKGAPQFIKGADTVSAELNVSADMLSNYGDQTSSTPFASLEDMTADPSVYSPFKPCTHGQFRFTKFNIIDKFGQVIQGIGKTADPAHGQGTTRAPLYPCLGEYYSVQQDPSTNNPRTVLQGSGSLNEFVQLPPSINQNARINADFLSNSYVGSTVTSSKLNVAGDYDDPVRGWLVLNYANASIQVFTARGVFIREFKALSGEVSTKPFESDLSNGGSTDPFLTSLLSSFLDRKYLAEMYESLSNTVASVQASPAEYAESMLSILGRPLALVSFGVSLELADPPLQNQCTNAPSNTAIDASNSVANYNFPVKIGDKDNVFDGLYGYFPQLNPAQTSTIAPSLSRFYTYHPASSNPTVTSAISPTDTVLKPFYADPSDKNVTLTAQRRKRTTILFGIIDPFTPVHIYSALLPIKTLTLPSFSISNGLANISTFFRLGPVLIPGDVPPCNDAMNVSQDYNFQSNPPATNGKITIPSVGLGEFAWLQPYGQIGTKYNFMDVDSGDGKMRWEKGPYTAVEGYLQQKTPFRPAVDTSAPATN